MCGHFIILGVELVLVVRAVRQANPAAAHLCGAHTIREQLLGLFSGNVQ